MLATTPSLIGVEAPSRLSDQAQPPPMSNALATTTEIHIAVSSCRRRSRDAELTGTAREGVIGTNGQATQLSIFPFFTTIALGLATFQSMRTTSGVGSPSRTVGNTSAAPELAN